MRAIAKFIGLIVSLPFFIAAISFAISNTAPLILSLWPFETQIVLPAALAVFIVLVVGFVLGTVSAFLGAGTLRRRLRKAESRLRRLEMEAARAERDRDAATRRDETAPGALSDRPALAAE